MAKDNDKAKSGNRRIVYLAALAGVIAGIGAVYVMERPSGNATPSEVYVQSDEASAQCALKADSLKSLDQAATGSVAAMRAAEKPISVAHIAFTGPDGKQMTLGDYKGKTLLVNLWATGVRRAAKRCPSLIIFRLRRAEAILMSSRSISILDRMRSLKVSRRDRHQESEPQPRCHHVELQ